MTDDSDGEARNGRSDTATERSCIRLGSLGRFFNVVDFVNRLGAKTRVGRQGRIAGTGLLGAGGDCSVSSANSCR